MHSGCMLVTVICLLLERLDMRLFIGVLVT